MYFWFNFPVAGHNEIVYGHQCEILKTGAGGRGLGTESVA
jgi:hypothetical protein